MPEYTTIDARIVALEPEGLVLDCLVSEDGEEADAEIEGMWSSLEGMAFLPSDIR